MQVELRAVVAVLAAADRIEGVGGMRKVGEIDVGVTVGDGSDEWCG
jgi:hypothetical protein